MKDDRIFIDSNIFIYTLDKTDPTKHSQAKKALCRADIQIVISTQVINEVYVVATKKLRLDPIFVREFIKTLYEFDMVNITAAIIDSAIDCSILNRLSYWDALMLSAASTAKCRYLWTEDLTSGNTYIGIKAVNPLSLMTQT